MRVLGRVAPNKTYPMSMKGLSRPGIVNARNALLYNITHNMNTHTDAHTDRQTDTHTQTDM